MSEAGLLFWWHWEHQPLSTQCSHSPSSLVCHLCLTVLSNTYSMEACFRRRIKKLKRKLLLWGPLRKTLQLLQHIQDPPPLNIHLSARTDCPLQSPLARGWTQKPLWGPSPGSTSTPRDKDLTQVILCLSFSRIPDGNGQMKRPSHNLDSELPSKRVRLAVLHPSVPLPVAGYSSLRGVIPVHSLIPSRSVPQVHCGGLAHAGTVSVSP